MAPLFSLLALVPLISALPHKRSTTDCGQYDTIAASPYTLFTNLWGESDATSGSQCVTLDSVSGDTVTWSTEFTWSGGTQVKSFSNAQLDVGLNKQLSAISSMPSFWSWSETSQGTIVADVAYDLFTSNTAGGSGVYEIMIWLANFNAEPISASYTSAGQPIPVETNVLINGKTWNLYHGSNGSNAVFSFLPTAGNIGSFNGDVNQFLTHLTGKGYIASSQYLTTAQAGVEATSGSATFTTSSYSLTIN